MAMLTVKDIWRPNLKREAKAVFGSDNLAHPGVDYLLNVSGPLYVSGDLEVINVPLHVDYHALRHTPEEIEATIQTEEMGYRRCLSNPQSDAPFSC